MDYRQTIIDSINRFYFEAIEEFREAEAKITIDSKFRRIFKKKDYEGNIKLLRSCKKISGDIRFPLDLIDEDDIDSQKIASKGEECIHLFTRLCDSYISMQTALENKANGEDLSFKEYTRSFTQTRELHSLFNDAIKELDILYADYTEDMDDIEGSEGEYMTYDMIAGEDRK